MENSNTKTGFRPLSVTELLSISCRIARRKAHRLCRIPKKRIENKKILFFRTQNVWERNEWVFHYTTIQDIFMLRYGAFLKIIFILDNVWYHIKIDFKALHYIEMACSYNHRKSLVSIICKCMDGMCMYAHKYGNCCILLFSYALYESTFTQEK